MPVNSGVSSGVTWFRTWVHSGAGLCSSREEISSENTGGLHCQALSCISVQLEKTDYESAALTVELQAPK